MASDASPTGHGLQVLRVYDRAERAWGDGRRVLVDRLWPRGVAKASLAYDQWAKDVAPSTELRKWYGHDVDRFAEFTDRYRAELVEGPPAAVFGALLDGWRSAPLTLLTATRDVPHSGAVVLAQALREAALR